MKYRMLMLILSVLLSSSVFAQGTNSAPVDMQKQQAITNVNQKDPEKMQQNGEILAWFIVLNKNEIAAANETLRHPVNPDVKKYAQLMRKEHTDNLNETKRLSQKIGIKPVMTENVKNAESDGTKIINTLKPIKDPKTYETTYIELMVDGHTNALKTIDNYLLNQTLNPRVETHLKMTRGYVQKHLDKAKEIQNKLNASAGTLT